MRRHGGGRFHTATPHTDTEEVVTSLFDLEAESGKEPRRSQGPERKRVWASLLAGKGAFIQDVKQEMDRRDTCGTKARAVVTDGERALQRRVCNIMKGVLLILDFLHALEKLWAVAHIFHPEGSQQAADFVRERALRVLRGEISQVVKGLRQMVTKRNGTLRDEVDSAHGGGDGQNEGRLPVGGLRQILGLPCRAGAATTIPRRTLDSQNGCRQKVVPDSIYCFDKGYTDFAWFHRINSSKAFFITRAKENLQYTVVGQQDVPVGGGVLSDEYIMFAGGSSSVGAATAIGKRRAASFRRGGKTSLPRCSSFRSRLRAAMSLSSPAPVRQFQNSASLICRSKSPDSRRGMEAAIQTRSKGIK
ncbi:MAG: hypothetical protein HY796_04115 [Elusimicrobia bacterium]|nr:hypothetical protein [Elusimicrobiota bacterium]